MYVLWYWCSLWFVNWHLLGTGQSWQLVTVVSDGHWFAISASLALIHLSASGMLLLNTTGFWLSWQLWRLVTRVGWWKSSCYHHFPCWPWAGDLLSLPDSFLGLHSSWMRVMLVFAAFRDPGNWLLWPLSWPWWLWVVLIALSVWLWCQLLQLVVGSLRGMLWPWSPRLLVEQLLLFCLLLLGLWSSGLWGLWLAWGMSDIVLFVSRHCPAWLLL